MLSMVAIEGRIYSLVPGGSVSTRSRTVGGGSFRLEEIFCHSLMFWLGIYKRKVLYLSGSPQNIYIYILPR